MKESKKILILKTSREVLENCIVPTF